MTARQFSLQVLGKGAETLPVVEAHSIPKLLTFGEAFQLYCEAHAKRYLKSYAEIVKLHRRYLTCLDDKPLGKINRLGVQSLHDAIGKHAGKAAANRAIEIISVVYNKMITWQLYDGVNPGSKIKKFRLKSRERFLQRTEAKAFFQAVRECKSEHVRDIVMIALLTGARSGNVLSMKWDSVDLRNRLWHIEDTKNGDSQTVPLMPEAITILNRRKKRHRLRGNPYVFPSRESKTGHMHNIRKSWYFILKRAGLKNFRFHDLRRSMGSWEMMTGASLPIIGKTLNHRCPQSTAVYARSDLNPVRIAMLLATTALWQAGGKKSKKEKIDPYASIEF